MQPWRKTSMNLWLHVFISLVCALTGVLIGGWFARLRRPYWMIGYFIPLILLIAFAFSVRFPTLMFAPPLSWMMMGMRKFVTFGFIATLVLTTPLSRLPRARDRYLVAFLMAIIVYFVSIWPFLAPMFDRRQLSRLQTKLDGDGICLQTTPYTCGPASAVTALHKLGLGGDEGKIAILSCTCDQEGTPVDMLGDALQKEYGAKGLVVQCRAFHNIAELREAGLTLAVIKYSLIEDHWVAVLGVTDTEVIVGDPLAGLTHVSHEDFGRRWRYIGIVLQRDLAQQGSK